jgi:FkbM family methyltransferase
MTKAGLKRIAYGVAEFCTAGRGVQKCIGGQPIRFPVRWSRYYPTDYESETFAFLRANCKPGQTAMDVGAHLGLFTVVMAQLVGPNGSVISFEPTPSLQQVLRRITELNGVARNVELRTEAVSESRGFATFYDTEEIGSNANSLALTSRSHHGIEVATISIDDVSDEIDRPIHCLKIDVEGAEIEALHGARRTFLNCRPAASVAIHPPILAQLGHTLDEFWDLVDEYRLEGWVLGKRVDRSWFVEQEGLFDVHLYPLER